MAVESKPLFHPEVLRQQVRSFSLPEQTATWRPKLQHWADFIRSGRADKLTETTLLPDFLTDFFCGLLGYTGPAESPDTFTFSRQRHVKVDGKVAKAVLGRFQKGNGQLNKCQDLFVFVWLIASGAECASCRDRRPCPPRRCC